MGTAVTYTYVQNAEGLIPKLTYDYTYDTVSTIIITGSRGKSYWTKDNPGNAYVILGDPIRLNDCSAGITSASVMLDTNNKKISFQFGYSYGKNNGDPSHTIYIAP